MRETLIHYDPGVGEMWVEVVASSFLSILK